MTEQVNELAAVSLRKPVKIFVDSNKTVAWNLQQEFIRIRPSQEAHQVRPMGFPVWSLFVELLSPVLDGFDQTIKLCTLCSAAVD